MDQPRRPLSRHALSRRRVLQASALVLPAAWALSACARAQPLGPTSSGAAPTGSGSSGGSSPAQLQIASPDNPVRWPIAAGNEPIASGLEPEANATLRLYNYPDYLDKGVLKDFQKEYADYNVKVEYSTFNDYPEAITKTVSYTHLTLPTKA